MTQVELERLVCDIEGAVRNDVLAASRAAANKSPNRALVACIAAQYLSSNNWMALPTSTRSFINKVVQDYLEQREIPLLLTPRGKVLEEAEVVEVAQSLALVLQKVGVIKAGDQLTIPQLLLAAATFVRVKEADAIRTAGADRPL